MISHVFEWRLLAVKEERNHKKVQWGDSFFLGSQEDMIKKNRITNWTGRVSCKSLVNLGLNKRQIQMCYNYKKKKKKNYLCVFKQ